VERQHVGILGGPGGAEGRDARGGEAADGRLGEPQRRVVARRAPTSRPGRGGDATCAPMCGRYTNTATNAGGMRERFELAEVPGERLPAVGIGWLSART